MTEIVVAEFITVQELSCGDSWSTCRNSRGGLIRIKYWQKRSIFNPEWPPAQSPTPNIQDNSGKWKVTNQKYTHSTWGGGVHLYDHSGGNGFVKYAKIPSTSIRVVWPHRIFDIKKSYSSRISPFFCPTDPGREKSSTEKHEKLMVYWPFFVVTSRPVIWGKNHHNIVVFWCFFRSLAFGHRRQQKIRRFVNGILAYLANPFPPEWS